MNINNVFGDKLRIFLYVTAFLQIVALLYFYSYFSENGYLPSPFLNDKSNTFMDFYNTLCWYSRGEYYSTWSSIYPPINFLFLELYQGLFNIESCSMDSYQYRADNIVYIYPFVFLFLLTPFVLLAVARRNVQLDFMSILLLGILIVFSPAMLFALERGNLILICIFFLAFLVNTERRFLQIFLILLLMNIKPYFLLLSLYFLARKDVKAFLLTCIGAFLFFLVTGQLLAENQFLIIENILGFSQSSTIFSLREALSFPPNISSFSYVLSSEKIPNVFHGLPISPYTMAYLIELGKKVVLLLALVVFLRNGHLLSTPLAFLYLTAIITNIGVSVGGYSLMFYLVFLPYIYFHRNNDWQFKILFTTIILMSLSFLDFKSLVVNNIGIQEAFLSGKHVIVNWSLTLGSFIRPSINFAFLMFMIFMLYKKNFFLNDDILLVNKKIKGLLRKV